MNIAIDESIQGVRGLIVKVFDTSKHLQKLYSNNNYSYWPYNESDHAKSPWNSIHFEFGI